MRNHMHIRMDVKVTRILSILSIIIVVGNESMAAQRLMDGTGTESSASRNRPVDDPALEMQAFFRSDDPDPRFVAWITDGGLGALYPNIADPAVSALMRTATEEADNLLAQRKPGVPMTDAERTKWAVLDILGRKGYFEAGTMTATNVRGVVATNIDLAARANALADQLALDNRPVIRPGDWVSSGGDDGIVWIEYEGPSGPFANHLGGVKRFR